MTEVLIEQGIRVGEFEDTIDGLQKLFANYQVYYDNLRGIHWNSQGASFTVFHRKFEELYRSAALRVDEIAERILMLGEAPVNGFSTYLRYSYLPEINGGHNWEDDLISIIHSLRTLISIENEVVQMATDEYDIATVSMMNDNILHNTREIITLSTYLS